MNSRARAFVNAARVPQTLEPQRFGLWEIKRLLVATPLERAIVGFSSYTLLHRHTDATIHLNSGECVMEDGIRELRQHLPIWMKARGTVLVTGLGLGCVVRGLLANPDVERVDVVEIDRDILRVIGAEFAGDPRVDLIHADALTWRFDPARRWDYAWHDLWVEPTAEHHLQHYHMELICRFRQACDRQGAWQMPRFVSRLAPTMAGLR